MAGTHLALAVEKVSEQLVLALVLLVSGEEHLELSEENKAALSLHRNHISQLLRLGYA
jgi:hypothetical protein